jgi:carboxymethylenebutenolidase
MCFDLEARPPAPPIFGSAASSEELVLQSADGTRFAAYAARASVPRGAGIVILPDVRGLHQFYKDLAVRFAETGTESVAIDYFGRTAGLTARDDAFEYMPHVVQTTRPQIAADVAAAVAYLRSNAGGAPRSIFTVGFCFGGDASWTQAANGHSLAGAIGFYGTPTRNRGEGVPSVIARVPEFACPILGLFGGDDPGIPASDVQAFEDALTRAGTPHELHTYAGAPHSFFDKRATDYAAASEDAWRRMLGFIAANTPGA